MDGDPKGRKKREKSETTSTKVKIDGKKGWLKQGAVRE